MEGRKEREDRNGTGEMTKSNVLPSISIKNCFSELLRSKDDFLSLVGFCESLDMYIHSFQCVCPPLFLFRVLCT